MFSFGVSNKELIISMEEGCLKEARSVGRAMKDVILEAPLAHKLVDDIAGGEIVEVVVCQAHLPAALRSPC